MATAEEWSLLVVEYSQRLQLLVTTKKHVNPPTSYSESNCPDSELHAGII